jgi:hypothetical protein
MNRTFQHEEFGLCRIETAKYANTGLAVQLLCPMAEAPEFYEPLAKLSTWLDATPLLPPNCFFAKTYGENEMVINEAAASGWFRERKDLKLGASGYAVYPVWELLETKGPGFAWEV